MDTQLDSIPDTPIMEPYQQRLFPLDAQDVFKNDQGSADLKLIVTAVNNKDYAVKTTADGNGYVPLTELFCYEVARELTIATPNYAIIKFRDNSIGFGSEWEGGAQELKALPMIFEILKGNIPVRGLKSFLSKVYALDLFINNIDRHFGNYIFRDSYTSKIGLAYDFSRAWYAIEKNGYQCLESRDDNKTLLCHTIIRKTEFFDVTTAINTLDEIGRIPSKTINRILSGIPNEWLPQEISMELLQWWGSSEMYSRINKLKSAIH